MQIINKVLTVGESKSKKSANSIGDSNGDNAGGGRERWVQFGTVASARLSLQDLTAKDAELNREGTSRLLQEYLSLPVEEYSLLDPKWVVREGEDDNLNFNNNRTNNSFRVSVPLKDMLGVDICPQVSIEARPDPLNSQVTLIGTKAVLGSPGLDDMFKLKLVAVMRCRRNDRHLPGRPVQRLRQWAAKRHGENNNKERAVEAGGNGGGGGGGGNSTAVLAEVVDVDIFPDLNFSEEDEEEEEEQGVGAVSTNFSDNENDEGGDSASFRFSRDISEEDTTTSYSSVSGTELSSSDTEERSSTTTASSATASSAATTTFVAAQAPLLDCKVQINMAVKVPGALRVVPNGLLGYAGSVLSKTVLNAVLPNFLQLLSNDFKQWVAGGGNRNEGRLGNDNKSGSSGSAEEVAGSLFTPLVSSSSTASSSLSSSDYADI
jgi:Protein of unknown function (DUF1997)